MKSQMSLKMGYMGLKTRSPAQILERLCVGNRGLIFGPILMKHGLNVCLDKVLDNFENGSCHVKNYGTRSNLRKNLMEALEATFSIQFS